MVFNDFLEMKSRELQIMARNRMLRIATKYESMGIDKAMMSAVERIVDQPEITEKQKRLLATFLTRIKA